MQDRNICRYCHKPILWAKTTKGRCIPLDPEEVRITPGNGPEKIVTADGAVVTGKPDPEGSVTGHRSHFATCPDAHKARKSDRRHGK